MGNRGATVAHAREVLAAIQSGTVPAEALDRLAASILDAEPVRLALEIRAGGEYAVRRAIELAALVLSGRVASSEKAGVGD